MPSTKDTPRRTDQTWSLSSWRIHSRENEHCYHVLCGQDFATRWHLSKYLKQESSDAGEVLPRQWKNQVQRMCFDTHKKEQMTSVNSMRQELSSLLFPSDAMTGTWWYLIHTYWRNKWNVTIVEWARWERPEDKAKHLRGVTWGRPYRPQ